ncbi:MAG TPA: histidine kinase famiy protein [Crenalkalicoccus sp.]|nr:histidine kinase famiy protein [Crenalkalicoccus sp.]
MAHSPGSGTGTHMQVTQAGFAGRDDVFFAAVELTRMPMIVTDPNQPDNPIVFANQAFMEMTGYAPDEVIGRNCRFLNGPATSQETLDAVRAAIRDRTNISVELLNYRKDGSTFWNALFISPVLGRDGELLYFFGSQLDVTRRRDAEAALRQAQKMEAVGQLTGGIAHDFNNLLTVIAGNLEMLLGAADPKRRQRLGQRINEAVGRAQRLTGQLLAFARKQQLDRRSVDLNALVSGMEELIRGTLGQAITLEFRLDPTLRPCRADPMQTEAALVNLLVNAREAMPTGGRVTISTARVTLHSEAPEVEADGLVPGEYVALRIEDEGRGMPPAVLGRAVEPFFTTKQDGGGSGLGLSTVYGFARQSGGHLRICSEEGQGTTVRLLFPAAEPAETQPQRLHRGEETVLLVDDNPDVREVASELLATLGYRVLTAASGREALAVLEAEPGVRVLLTDLVMPGGMNGISLAEEARRRRPTLPVLLATGYAEGPDRGEAGDGLPLVTKPYRRAELAQRLRQVLDGKDR